MVGNAVPVNLAFHIAMQIKSDLFSKYNAKTKEEIFEYV